MKTASGATAVQIVHSSVRGSRQIEHVGSAHTPEQVAALKAVAWQRIAGGQAELDLGFEVAAAGGPLDDPARDCRPGPDELPAGDVSPEFG